MDLRSHITHRRAGKRIGKLFLGGLYFRIAVSGVMCFATLVVPRLQRGENEVKASEKGPLMM
jgi:hypothetical protein